MTVEAVITMTQYENGSWSSQMVSEVHPEWNRVEGHESPNDALLAAARWIKHAEEPTTVNTVRVMLCHHEDGSWGTMVRTEPQRLEWEFSTGSFDDPVSALVATTGKVWRAEPQSGPLNTVAGDIAKAQTNENPYLEHAVYRSQIAQRVADL